MPALFKNNASALLAASISNTATTIVVSAGIGNSFPNPSGTSYFYGTLFDSVGNYEIVKCTARTTDTLTVVRGQDGTNPLAFTAGDGFALRPVAAVFNNLAQLDGNNTFAGTNTFTAANTFTGTNTFTGGITGTLTGNVVGNAATATLATTATTALTLSTAENWGVTSAVINTGTVTGSIASTTLTVTAVASGQVTNGYLISGTGVTANTKIVTQINATGSTVVTSKTFDSSGEPAQNYIVLNNLTSVAVGQFVVGSGVPAGTVVVKVLETGITLSNNFTSQATGTYEFYPAKGIGTYTVNTSQTVASTAITVSNSKLYFSHAGTNVVSIDIIGTIAAGTL